MSSPYKHRKKKELNEADPEFQVAPMADLLFVLLVFFMSITTTEVLRVDKKIDLPIAKDSMESKNKSRQVVLNLDWEEGAKTGTIKIDDQLYPTADAIIPLLRERLAADPALRVLIRSDKVVQYFFVADIMQACSKAQITNVTFSVMNQEAAGAPPASSTAS
jgi:biopolymer transport protein ExbD